MKKYLIFFTISIFLSVILIALGYLFSFTPIDPKNGNFLSNCFLLGFIFISIGIFRIRPNKDHRDQRRSYHEHVAGVTPRNQENTKRDNKITFFKAANANAYAYLTVGVINLILSFTY